MNAPVSPEAWVADNANMPAAIGEAILAIMGKVRNVEKNGKNDFHNYKFARVEDLMFQVQPAMAEAGLVITQDELHHGIEADALMLATYAFSLSHKSGVTWGPVRQTGMSNIKNSKGGFDDKALNKCHTAARKYFILGLFQVPAGDLPDADTEGDAPPGQRGFSAEQTAINMLRGASADAGLFKQAWNGNKDGWKKILSADAYARVVAVMQEEAAKFVPAPADPPPVETAPAERPAVEGFTKTDFGIGDDDIPF